MNTAAEDEVYAVAKMTANKRLEFQVHLSNAETETNT